jgi:hypothetical protein
MAIPKSINFLTQINYPFDRFSKQKGVTQIPIPGDEKDLFDQGGFKNLLKKRKKKLIYENPLIGNHIFISLRWRKGGEEVAAEGYDFCRGGIGQR